MIEPEGRDTSRGLRGQAQVGDDRRVVRVRRLVVEHLDALGSELVRELVALVRKNIGPVADFKHATVVQALPKTRSGKILRKTMRQIADGEDYVVPSTIEDAGVIDQLIGSLRPAAARE